MKDNKKFGAGGEGQATAYLVKNGYKILHRNFTCHCGEIDIIASKKGVIAFIEVKARLSDNYGTPAEAVTSTKKHKISLTAVAYIKMRKLYDNDISFDIIEVFHDNINHIENAFESTIRW